MFSFVCMGKKKLFFSQWFSFLLFEQFPSPILHNYRNIFNAPAWLVRFRQRYCSPTLSRCSGISHSTTLEMCRTRGEWATEKFPKLISSNVIREVIFFNKSFSYADQQDLLSCKTWYMLTNQLSTLSTQQNRSRIFIFIHRAEVVCHWEARSEGSDDDFIWNNVSFQQIKELKLEWYDVKQFDLMSSKP